MDSSQTAAGDRLGPSVMKEVLHRLAQRRLEPTPENFSRVYREVSSAFAVQVGRQYTNETMALRHALEAFENLLIGNAWVNGKFRELGRVVADDTARDEVRLASVRKVLNEVMEGKEQALHQAARLVVEMREAVNEMIVQAQELAHHVSSSRATFARASQLADDCFDLADVRRAMDAIARDARRLNRAAEDGKKELVTGFSQFATSSRYLLGPPVAGAPRSPSPKREAQRRVA